MLGISQSYISRLEKKIIGKMKKEILVGSNAFFKDIPHFKSKDRDYLVLTDEDTNFKVRKEICLKGIDKFYYKLDTPQNMVQQALEINDPFVVGKFLVKDVAETIGLSVDDILPLEELLNKVDKEHEYQKIIFKYIKENNSFDLTKEQLSEAYEAYSKTRENNKYKK